MVRVNAGERTMDRWAKTKLIEFAAGTKAAKQTIELLERDIDEKTQEFAGSAPTPIERTLAETATFSWFALRHYEAAYVSASQSDNGLTLKQADYHLRRIDRAHRRLLSTLKTLATIRRLALPTLQINVASQQVNQVNPGGSK
jgi:hypothetical protein